MALRPLPIDPSAQQLDILRSPARRLIVEANAGAAKTTTLALRVRQQLDAGTAPERILVLTFTTPACEAVRKALGRVGIASELARQVHVHTFDQFATQRLRRAEGYVPVLEGAEQVKPFVLSAIARCRSNEHRVHPEAFFIPGNGEASVEGFLAQFRRLKGTMQLLREGEDFELTPRSAQELDSDYTALAVFNAYERLRLGVHPHDSDNPLFRHAGDPSYDLARLLLSDELGVLALSAPLALELELVAVDEMHDVGHAMCVMLRGVLDANPRARFIGVGDKDQVLHAEAGADAVYMREGFDHEIGPAERLPLVTSRRFGERIAGLLGRHAGKRYAALDARRSRVEVIEAASPCEVCREIQRALEHRPGLSPGAGPGELAVILRHPARAVALENELLGQGVPYVTVGFRSYLGRPEILFVMGVLLAALDLFQEVKSLEIRTAIVEALQLFTGDSVRTTVHGIEGERVEEEHKNARRVAQGGNFGDFVRNHLMKRVSPRASQAMMSAMAVALSNHVTDVPSAVATLDVPWFASQVFVQAQAVRDAADSVAGLVEATSTYDTIEQFLRATLAREALVAVMNQRDRAKRVQLSTVEASKGLEFDHVLIPDVDVGRFDGDSTAEKNRFYVAASRARHLLTLTHRPGRASTYLAAVDEPPARTPRRG